MKSNGLFSNLAMPAVAAICAAILAPAAAHAETWYWVGLNANSSGQHLWNGGLNNWTNANGVAGDPARGDNAVLTENDYQAYMVCNSNGGDTGDHSPRVALNSIVFDGYMKNCNQGNFAFVGGGEGLTVLGVYALSHYTGILLEGEGEVPFNIVDASSEFRGQMRVVIRKDPSGVCRDLALVKKGLGTLVSYYQTGDRQYEIPLNKIQQGRLDVTTGMTLRNIEFRFDGNDPSARLSWGFGGAKSPFFLGSGCAITESADVANTEHGILCQYNQQLQFSGVPGVNPMTFSGQFYGGAGLRWDPSSSDYAFVYSNAVSATTGRIDVVTGTVKLVNGASFTALTSLSVGAAGTLEVESGSGAGLRANALDVLAGGKLRLGAGVVVTVGAATLDTLPVRAGTYAASAGAGVKAASWIEGAGTVVVETGDADSARWIGTGTDTNIATAGNWIPDVPDLVAGDTFALFSEGGHSANLNRDARFAGLSLNGGFSFAGSGTLSIGGMGVASLDVATATEYNIGCPVELAAGQVWTVGANNTLNVNGGLSGSGSLVVSGDGVLNIGGENTHAGPVDIGSKATIGGVNALGAAGTVARVRNDSGAICFSSATNAAAVSFYSIGAPSDGHTLSFAGDSVFNGPVTNEMITIEVPADASVEFAKRYRGNIVKFSGAGNVIFRDRLVLSGSHYTFYMDKSGSDVTVDMHAGNNSFSGTFWSNLLYGRIRCHVPYAMQASGVVNGPSESKGTRVIFAAPFVLDLGGCDQSVDGLSAAKGGTVTSDEPAFFRHVAKNPYHTSNDPDGGNVNRTNNLVFVGMAGFSHDGPMTNRLGGVSTTAGTLQVTNGKLILLPQASWSNCTSVVVSNGVLAVENDQAFHKKLVMNIFNDGKVALDFDGVLKCNELYVDGIRMGGGLYCAAGGSGFGRVDEHFLGRGTVRVQPRGTRISLR